MGSDPISALRRASCAWRRKWTGKWGPTPFLSAGAALPTVAIFTGDVLLLATSSNSAHHAGLAITAGGMAIGLVSPSLGEWYSHEYLTVGMGARTLGFATIGLGALQMLAQIENCSAADPCPHGSDALGFGLVVGGAALYVGGIAFDVVHARHAAQTWNSQHARIVPTANVTSTSTTVGIATTW